MHDMNATHQPTPTLSPNPHKLLITRRVVLSVYIYMAVSHLACAMRRARAATCEELLLA